MARVTSRCYRIEVGSYDFEQASRDCDPHYLLDRLFDRHPMDQERSAPVHHIRSNRKISGAGCLLLITRPMTLRDLRAKQSLQKIAGSAGRTSCMNLKTGGRPTPRTKSPSTRSCTPMKTRQATIGCPTIHAAHATKYTFER